MTKNAIKEGIQVDWSETPDIYDYKILTPQSVGKTQKHLHRAFKASKGFVTVQNKFIKVIVHADGRIEIAPHDQVSL